MVNCSHWRPSASCRRRARELRLAGVNDRVAVLEGPALNSLEKLGDRPPFDLIFIDADKPNNPDYLRWALRILARDSDCGR